MGQRGRIVGCGECTVSLDLTMNDRQLSDCVFLITQRARQLNELIRDNRLIQLRDTLQEIQDAAMSAGYRCNDIRYGNEA